MPSTSLPALRGLTPATTCAPDATMRRVCLVPSPPVMPCTRIFEFSVSQIAMSDPRSRELGSPAGRTVHRVDELDDVALALAEDPPAFLGVVPVKAYDEWLAHDTALGLDQLDGLHDAVGHRVAGRDATEDVDEHRAHVRVVEDDVEPVGHHLRRRAAADVEEVGGLDATELPAGVSHHVQRAHDES